MVDNSFIPSICQCRNVVTTAPERASRARPCPRGQVSGKSKQTPRSPRFHGSVPIRWFGSHAVERRSRRPGPGHAYRMLALSSRIGVSQRDLSPDRSQHDPKPLNPGLLRVLRPLYKRRWLSPSSESATPCRPPSVVGCLLSPVPSNECPGSPGRFVRIRRDSGFGHGLRRSRSHSVVSRSFACLSIQFRSSAKSYLSTQAADTHLKASHAPPVPHRCRRHNQDLIALALR